MKRLFVVVLALLLLGSSPVWADNFNPAQKGEIEQIIKQYLLNNPEILYQAAENQQRNEERKADERANKVLKDSHDALFKNSDHPFIGNPKASVALIEFFDYNCGYCKQAFPGLMKTLDEDKDLKIILMDTPILSRESLEAAKWALAAKEQGKYAEFHQALMEQQGPKGEENLTKIATDLKLDMKQLRAAVESDKVRTTLAANMELFRALGLNGTPAFAASDRVIRGYVGPEVIKQIAADLRAGKGVGAEKANPTTQGK